jgi:hypothetical protein
MYNKYLTQTEDTSAVVRQVCRKLDLYWNKTIFEDVERRNTTHSMMTAYMAKLNTTRYAGKCYDDTLSDEGALWSHIDASDFSTEDTDDFDDDDDGLDSNEEIIGIDDSIEITDEIIAFWGPGFTTSMYRELEQRRRYWMSRFPEDTILDVGTEALIRQICNLEISINKNRASGKQIDKNINMLNTLLGSLNLKPSQNKDDGDASLENTPFGVWIRRWENQRPIPEVDPEMKDVDGIIRYIETWFKGHLSKMLNIKNAYSQIYENEIDKYRVEKPEYEDDDDETIFNEVFGGDPE